LRYSFLPSPVFVSGVLRFCFPLIGCHEPASQFFSRLVVVDFDYSTGRSKFLLVLRFLPPSSARRSRPLLMLLTSLPRSLIFSPEFLFQWSTLPDSLWFAGQALSQGSARSVLLAHEKAPHDFHLCFQSLARRVSSVRINFILACPSVYSSSTSLVYLCVCSAHRHGRILRSSNPFSV
jgi:hypothetical protein